MARRENRHPAQWEQSLKYLWWLLAIGAIAGGAWWIVHSRGSVPEVKFVKPRRETLTSVLPTNAKAEPVEWSAVRVEAPGLVVKLPVHQGDAVRAGQPLAQVGDAGLAEQLKAAESRTAQIQSELGTLAKGGKSAELTDIQNRLATARFEHDNGAKEYGSLKRLHDKQAATMVEVESAHDKVRQAELQIESLERRRAALVSQDDVAATEARLHEAQATQRLAQIKLSQGAIRSPMTGVVYDLPARLGSFLNTGDLVASVGRIDSLRIRVYVDEPELGRVAVGQPVKIAWDALPGKSWMGKVERMPSEIVALGTRQVGEVLCTIANPGRELAPGANVNAEIVTNVVENALTAPKEALHREGGRVSLWVLEGGETIRLRQVQAGTANATRQQVVAGLRDGELVALPVDRVLKDGEKVKALEQ
jgi:HlyD family secretion protein